jgi:hypothetical protein
MSYLALLESRLETPNGAADAVPEERGRVIPFETARQHWLTWGQWMDRQRERIVAEGRTARAARVGNQQADKATPFQRSFFAQLGEIPACSKAKFVRQASERGIPRECANAFLRSKQRLKKPKTAQGGNERCIVKQKA